MGGQLKNPRGKELKVCGSEAHFIRFEDLIITLKQHVRIDTVVS